MTEIIIILLLALFVNVIINVLDRLLMDKEAFEKLKEKRDKIKNIKDSKSLEKELEEISEIYRKIFPKQMMLLTINFAIFISILTFLNYMFGSKIIIPLPFKLPITNRYGIGPLGTYILCSIILSPIIKKLINKIPMFEKWHGEK